MSVRPTDILRMTASQAQVFRFGTWGSREARNSLLEDGALPQFATQPWVDNHYRWIVWKIACMIRSFPEFFSNWWCAIKVFDQLRYRSANSSPHALYEREINHAHRSAIKRIIEQDDTPSKHMVLCVSDIIDEDRKTGHTGKYTYEIVCVISVMNSNIDLSIFRGPGIFPATECDASSRTCPFLLELTDGWYRIYASIDTALQRAVSKEKIKIGSKLAICGAQVPMLR
ncbi:BRCA2, oligonucleotide/oligosaccharide-binding, domain 1-domain-containing protein [Jimgerdemannia flammicorona]|uniref:BRCA2, oligonucleotide/oligosaccharide-binding, domain 1-domain-containing protein n=1 Tax=Jimgerdemannia flammicorona TaxID=994334 RepID=A0A433BED3_9FUNG|nr:BRCA2, oligonucleotide/oligosaccharide-binding, domain 1-domain-containing protein [Jimgerdemannia flammicorona]